jgi:hypothetical protein
LKKKTTFLLLDVLPYELPLIYSNEKLSNFIESNSDWEKFSIEDIKLEVTQPFNFNILKNDHSNRVLSLLHPVAQLQWQKFIEKYDNEIINFFKVNALFSIRYPNEINSVNQKDIDKINAELFFMFNEDIEINNNEIQKYMDSYFSKHRFIKITDFYKSNFFKRLETKYSLLYKIDISNCFYNIYTHSIDWAYLGNKEYAKRNKDKNQKRFSLLLDQIMQKSNDDETNGIVVGPEFSRIVAEIVLSRIDNLVFKKLKELKLYFKHHYEVVRYIDDIFIFANSEKTALTIKEIYEEFCSAYKLKINELKSYFENAPFLRKHIWVVKLKKILNQYFNIFEQPERINKNNIRRITNNFIAELRTLIIEFEEEKHSIVSYILSTFEKVWISLISEAITKISDENCKIYLLSKLLDLLHYVLVFSITAQNVIKYTKLSILIKNKSAELKENSIPELIYKKTLELIKYHKNRNTEILNLIIALKEYEKDLPEKILLDLLKGNSNYFSLATISYYIDNGDRSFRYKKLRSYINEEIMNVLQRVKEKYILPSTDRKKLKELILSKEFYIIHDFYSCKIVNKNVKREIKNIKDRINRERWNRKEELLFNIFVDYIKDFDKPFMRWDATHKDLIRVLVEKTSKIDTTVSG